MRIGFVQMTPIFGETQKNLKIAASLIEKQSADLLVLPEFFNTGYLFSSSEEVSELSESADSGRTVKFLSEVAGDTGITLVAGFPERDGSVFYNSAILIIPGGKTHLYRKTHLFDREKLFFSPGNTGFNVFDTGDARVGIMICFDWFFPESARSLALSGAQIIAHPSNLVLPHCPKAMVTRCLENRVFSITSNRSGSEDRKGMKLNYIGNSRIINPAGTIIAGAGEEKQQVKVIEIDPHLADQKRINSRNDLFADRRTELYKAMTR
ncbi:acyltransferase [bacterium]|nr:acyltransferase [bacterium]